MSSVSFRWWQPVDDAAKQREAVLLCTLHADRDAERDGWFAIDRLDLAVWSDICGQWFKIEHDGIIDYEPTHYLLVNNPRRD